VRLKRPPSLPPTHHPTPGVAPCCRLFQPRYTPRPSRSERCGCTLETVRRCRAACCGGREARVGSVATFPADEAVGGAVVRAAARQEACCGCCRTSHPS
jgi:hypothetical protein